MLMHRGALGQRSLLAIMPDAILRRCALIRDDISARPHASVQPVLFFCDDILLKKMDSNSGALYDILSAGEKSIFGAPFLIRKIGGGGRCSLPRGRRRRRQELTTRRRRRRRRFISAYRRSGRVWRGVVWSGVVKTLTGQI